VMVDMNPKKAKKTMTDQNMLTSDIIIHQMQSLCKYLLQ
jgi:hypothetical protein